MSKEAVRQYSDTLRQRRAGVPSAASGSMTLAQAKPEFYADSRLWFDAVQDTSARYRQTYPPYGLVPEEAARLKSIRTDKDWLPLERALTMTMRQAFNETPAPVATCPYHESLKNLGGATLKSVGAERPDIDRFREVAAPGGLLAPALIVNLLRRVPAMAQVTGATSDAETLARNSRRSLLREPLQHPQQWALAFVFCMGEGYRGLDKVLVRESFLPDDLIDCYVTTTEIADGVEALTWAMPTADFTLRTNVSVPNRLEGPEYVSVGDHITTYPAGTRLGDIRVDEPSVGCPGSRLAYAMWDQATDVIVGEKLWETAA